MAIETNITCDALDCFKSIDCDGSDSPQEILDNNNWHFDPLTEEFQYCDTCWPEVKAEYADLEADGGLI
jgi:hypothetical protein